MRPTIISLLMLASTSASFAQNAQPPANRDANTPAVNSPNSPPNPGAPVAGANSFTEGQARSRIEDKGFKNVSGLKKDDSGVWRAKADHNGKAVNVSVDFLALKGMATAMGEATDTDDFSRRRRSLRGMAATATEADIKDLWLRMAAAWRRQVCDTISRRRR